MYIEGYSTLFRYTTKTSQFMGNSWPGEKYKQIHTSDMMVDVNSLWSYFQLSHLTFSCKVTLLPFGYMASASYVHFPWNKAKIMKEWLLLQLNNVHHFLDSTLLGYTMLLYIYNAQKCSTQGNVPKWLSWLSQTEWSDNLCHSLKVF